MNYNNNHRQQQLVLPTPADLGVLGFHYAKNFARRHKVITASYFFGIIVLLLGGSGFKLSMDQRRNYDRILSTIDAEAEYHATNNYARAYQNYYASKGWFTCDSLCQRHKQRMEISKSNLDQIRKEGNDKMSDAKSVAGIFSELGVGEAKDYFWEKFDSGKRFAKRQSMWDAFFIAMRSVTRGRDESFIEYAMKVLMQILVNFSMGLVMALIFFVIGLWSLVRSYQPDPLTALIFFVTATCAAFSFVATYLFVIYGAAATSVYGVAKFAETNMRIEGGGNNNRRQYVQNRRW